MKVLPTEGLEPTSSRLLDGRSNQPSKRSDSRHLKVNYIYMHIDIR